MEVPWKVAFAERLLVTGGAWTTRLSNPAGYSVDDVV